MAGLSMGSFNDDPTQIVRTIARIAQMLVELRDEFAASQREDTLDQIERRLDELSALHEQLRRRREIDAE